MCNLLQRQRFSYNFSQQSAKYRAILHYPKPNSIVHIWKKICVNDSHYGHTVLLYVVITRLTVPTIDLIYVQSNRLKLSAMICFIFVWWSSRELQWSNRDVWWSNMGSLLGRCGGLLRELWWSNREVWWSNRKVW